MGNFRPRSVQCHIWVIRYTCVKIACKSICLGVQRNGLEFGSWGMLIVHIWGTLDLIVLKVIWGHLFQND